MENKIWYSPFNSLDLLTYYLVHRLEQQVTYNNTILFASAKKHNFPLHAEDAEHCANFLYFHILKTKII